MSVNFRVLPMVQALDLISAACPDCQKKMRDVLSPAASVQKRPLASGVIADTISEVSEALQVSAEELLGARQHARIVNARRAVAIRLRAAGYSYPQIGAALGKHHTTIMHLVQGART